MCVWVCIVYALITAISWSHVRLYLCLTCLSLSLYFRRSSDLGKSFTFLRYSLYDPPACSFFCYPPLAFCVYSLSDSKQIQCKTTPLKIGQNNVDCVCVFSSHSFWTSSSLDVPAGVTQEEGHTGFLIHLLSAVRALVFSREGFSHSFPLSTVKSNFVYNQFNGAPRVWAEKYIFWARNTDETATRL